MSKTHRLFALLASVFLVSPHAAAQDIEATIVIDAVRGQAAVSGRFLTPQAGGRAPRVRFLNSFGSNAGLGRRILTFQSGNDIEEFTFHGVSNGDFLARGEVKWWTSRVNLTPLKNTAAAAHTSWLSGAGGILLLDDLLPQDRGRAAKIKFNLPTDWKIYSTARSIGADEYEVDDIEKAAFFVGRDWRIRPVSVGNMSIRLMLSGEWQFSDEEAAGFVAEITADYLRLFGPLVRETVKIAFVKFPGSVGPGLWEAGARGQNITIASSDMPFKSQSVQRLHEQLRHELFHLWIPNGVNLTGNYDWFYEGFALYHSLKTAVAMNRIRFDDYLDTLTRAYRIDGSGSNRKSLIESSSERWSGADTSVYARGLLVAFLCDVALLEKSRGKRSAATVLAEIFRKHRPPTAAQPGNAAVISVLRSNPELRPLIDRYVEGREAVDQAAGIAAAGLEFRDDELRLIAKPTGRQRDLLARLGYNRWRKQ